MELSTEKRLRVERLLLQREAIFARIHALEARIEEIFGDEWAFDVPDLLSMRAKKKKQRGGRSAKSAKAPRAPALEEGEVAYRVSYVQAEVEMVETYADEKALTRLLNLPLDSVVWRKVETLDEAGNVVRTVMSWTEGEG